MKDNCENDRTMQQSVTRTKSAGAGEPRPSGAGGGMSWGFDGKTKIVHPQLKVWRQTGVWG